MRGQLAEDIGTSRGGNGVQRTDKQWYKLKKDFRQQTGGKVNERAADLGEQIFPDFPSSQKPR